MSKLIPKYDDLMAAVLGALRTLGGSGTTDEILDKVQEALQLPEAALSAAYPKSGALIFPDRLSWARSYLKLAGYVDNPQRGLWILTEKGQTTDLKHTAAIKESVRLAFNDYSRRTAKDKGQGASLPTSETEEEGDWQTQLLKTLGAMPPDAFERLCQRVLRESGFVKVEVTGRSGDGGIDGHGVLRVKLVSFQVLFQAKRWRDSVGASVVRDFRGAMVGRADKGLIMTTGRFTADARREATRDGAPAIDLVDGEDLCLLLKDLGIGVKVRMVEEVSIDEAVFQGL